MNTQQKEKIVPEQQEGTQKDINHSVTTINKNDAQKLFLIGRTRLLDVNCWRELCGAASSTFRLTDAEGNEVMRTAEKGDHFKIDIPVPGPISGNGYDWVLIDAIDDTSDSEGETESIIMRVRPSHNPQEKGENVAHFFSDEATSSFAIYRNNLTITAAVHGRNEVANTETNNVLDKIRNTIVALTAKLGFSDVQWKNLVKGLIVNS